MVSPRKVAKAQASLAKKDREIARMTSRFLLLKEQLRRDAVETIREMGEILEQGARRLRGSYVAWLEQLGVSASAARNYRRVFAFSETTPDLFVKWKDIGPNKMSRLSRVEPKKRRPALAKKLRGKDVFAMTDAEFATTTSAFLKPTRAVTDNMKAHGLRMKVMALTMFLQKAQTLAPKDPEVRRSLAASLAELIKAARTLKRSAC